MIDIHSNLFMFGQVSPALRDCMPNASENSMRDLVDLYESRKVVGTTCLGIGE